MVSESRDRPLAQILSKSSPPVATGTLACQPIAGGVSSHSFDTSLRTVKYEVEVRPCLKVVDEAND